MSKLGTLNVPFARWRKWLILSLAYLGFVGGACFAAGYLPDAHFGAYLTALVLLTLMFSLWYLVPRRWTLIAAPALTLLLWYVLDEANRQKSILTSFPLTIIDLRMFAANPSGLLMSIGSPKWTYLILEAAPLVLLALLGWFAYRTLRHSSPRVLINGVLGFAVRALIVVAALILLNQANVRAVTSFLRSHKDVGIWEDVGLVKFASMIGVIPFLSYSQYIEATEPNNFLNYTAKVPPPSREAILKSVDKYIDTGKLSPRALPNIFIIHAESTFDLNDVLDMKSPVSSDLFYTYPKVKDDNKVHFRGSLLANIIGGGSWVSEFEVLHGIDSRLFGVAGHYTHASLSMYSQRALPRYLEKHGYQTYAYYPTGAKFYNAEQAFRRYGFKDFQSDVGSGGDDTTIMAPAVADRGQSGPFMKFVELLENHAPHWCDEAKAQSYENIDVVGNATDTHRCALKEYVRRLRTTERAVQMARDYLEAEQARTGRPYVIAIYGDHQPYSFTGGGEKQSNMGLDFDAFRKDASKRKAILEFISSMENPIRCCWNETVPITLVPSMISAYVARSPDELYLPVNFYQLDHCGSDWIGYLSGTSYYGIYIENMPKRCAEYDAIVAADEQSGIIGYPDKATNALAVAQVPKIASPSVVKASCRLPGGDTPIVVSASGTRFGEPPKFQLNLDGKEIGSASVDAAPDTTSKAADQQAILQAETLFEFHAPLTQESKQVTLEFLNDKWAGPGMTGDTDLWIRYVRVGDRVFTGRELKPTSLDKMRGVTKGEWFVFATTGMLRIVLPQERCG